MSSSSSLSASSSAFPPAPSDFRSDCEAGHESGMFKFPALAVEGADSGSGSAVYSPASISSATSPAPGTLRRNSGARHVHDPPAFSNPPRIQTRPHRQKSLSEALHTIRTRRSSMSANAQELAEALKPPVSGKLVVLCFFWYFSSIASNTSSKTILNVFPYPVTLTLVQFAFVSSWCVFLGSLAQMYPSFGRQFPAIKNGVRAPSRTIVMATLPLTAFQIGGHILSSDATSRLPVSLVHTIKGLSPLFTVFFYRAFLGVQYNMYTYLSLIPLMTGVFLACSANLGSAGNLLGLLSAFSSTILFVTQNIVSKNLFNEAAAAEASSTVIPVRLRKPDKLNLLCYSTGIAFFFTFPLWLWSEGHFLINEFVTNSVVPISGASGSVTPKELMVEFFFNGTCHFLQSLVAFTLLSLVSPVTYSIGSLIKRVFVILFAIVWFRNSFTNTQAFGILITFIGLYLYDRTSEAHGPPRRSRAPPASLGEPMLPIYEKGSGSDGSGMSRSAFLSPGIHQGRDLSPIYSPMSMTPQPPALGSYRSTPSSAISMASTLVGEDSKTAGAS